MKPEVRSQKSESTPPPFTRVEFLLLVLLLLIVASIFLGGCGRERLPEAGDVYAEYIDNRGNEWALKHGFAEELIVIHKVTEVTNDTVYCAALSMPITNTGNYPFPYNEWGPASNFIRFKQYRTLVRPIPK